MTGTYIVVHGQAQKLELMRGEKVVFTASISTAKKGFGARKNSEQTPLGWHYIRAKIGQNLPLNSVLLGRRPTGEIYTPALGLEFPERDWILTRILWLSGLELGKNRLGNLDTMQRYIYIHGTPAENPMGIPLSHGCIRMHSEDILRLFDLVDTKTQLLIQED